MSGRHKMIDRVCENCFKNFSARLQRVNQGKGRFCSIRCANEFQRKEAAKKFGWEFGRKYWDGKKWTIHYQDDKGKDKTTSYANWWWKMYKGEIPDGYVVSYKDNDYSNISPNNFYLKLRSQINRENGSKGNTISFGFLGKHHSDEWKKKKSESQLGRKLSPEHKANIGRSVKMRWDRGDFDNTIFIDISGDKNPSWRGGAGTEYPEGWNRKLKKFIWERDHSVCQICGTYVSSQGKVGHVHHIDGHKENLEYDNLILLCQTCHTKIHKSKDVSSPVIMAFREKLYWNH